MTNILFPIFRNIILIAFLCCSSYVDAASPERKCAPYPRVDEIYSKFSNSADIETIKPSLKELSEGEMASMMWAALIRENYELAQILVDSGANINAINSCTSHVANPLNSAITRRSERLIDFLLTNGADITGEPEEKTPLYLAMEYVDNRTVKKLLEKGKGIYTQAQLDKAFNAIGLHPWNHPGRLLLLKAGAKPTLDNQCDAVFCSDGSPGEGIPSFLYRNSTLTVYEWPSQKAKSEVWKVEPNKQVKWIGSRVNSSKTIVRKALEDFVFECGEVKAGDTIEILQYAAEGYYHTLHNNKVCESMILYSPKTILVGEDGIVSQWWIKIQKQGSNEKGWIIANEENLVFLDRSF